MSKILSLSWRADNPHTYRHFDTLRGLSAIAVLATHLHGFLFARFWGLDTTIAILAGLNGRIAVIIFLLLSGYLITQSVCRNIARNGYFNLAEYSIARVARIYPPF